MRAIALALVLGLNGIEMAIKHETMMQQSQGAQDLTIVIAFVFVGCLIAGI